MEDSKTVLIAEGDSNMRASLVEAVGRMGFATAGAASSEEALRKLDTNHHCLLVADVNLPGDGGIILMQKAGKLQDALPVILISSGDSAEGAVECMRIGASDYLLKPFSADVLSKSISSALGITVSSGTPKLAIKQSGDKWQIITKDKKMLELLDIIDRTAASKASMLIQGESGTGKEMVARTIHNRSNRASGPFVAVNCAALPESLLESELFGHEKGAFTGAIGRKIGKFEMAEGGTILLDEITEMQVELQAKLLRVLQEKEIDRVGGTATIPIDVRVVATTNRNIEDAISEGRFREDLYFRLNVIPLIMPPLRERKRDLPILIEHFISKFCEECGKNILAVAEDAMDVLANCKWRGNIRELENVMERAVLLSRGEIITKEDLFLTPTQSEATQETSEDGKLEFSGTVDEMERKLILGTLNKTDNNRTQAAEQLGISIRTLRNKLNDYKAREAASEPAI